MEQDLRSYELFLATDIPSLLSLRIPADDQKMIWRLVDHFATAKLKPWPRMGILLP